MNEPCCERGCITKEDMDARHGDPQQFWEALLDANTQGFVTMAEARASYEQYRTLYDAAPTSEPQP